MSERCKARIWSGGFQPVQCSRAPFKDGYCRTHHPDSVAKRRAERTAKFEREWAVREANRKLREHREKLADAAPDLVEALKAVLAQLELVLPTTGLVHDERQAIIGAKAALAKAGALDTTCHDTLDPIDVDDNELCRKIMGGP